MADTPQHAATRNGMSADPTNAEKATPMTDINGWACDQHIETDDEFWGGLLGDDDPCAPGKDWIAAAFTEGPIDLTAGEATR